MLVNPEGVAERSFGQGDWVVITLDGDIDLARGDELAGLLSKHWLPTQNLLVDLGPVTFIDATGLQWLIFTRETVVDAGREMRLIVPEGGCVERLLQLVRVDEVFVIHRNLDKALAQISDHQALSLLDKP